MTLQKETFLVTKAKFHCSHTSVQHLVSLKSVDVFVSFEVSQCLATREVDLDPVPRRLELPNLSVLVAPGNNFDDFITQSHLFAKMVNF